jgi:hypothetical protein
VLEQLLLGPRTLADRDGRERAERAGADPDGGVHAGDEVLAGLPIHVLTGSLIRAAFGSRETRVFRKP